MFGFRVSAHPPPRLPGPTGSAIGFAAAVAATVLDAVLGTVFGVGSRPVLGLALLAAVAVGVGALTTVMGALGCAAQCWGMYSGFVVHQFGELRLDPPGAFALLLLVGLAEGASVLGLALGVAHDRTRVRASTTSVGAKPVGTLPVARRPVPVGGRPFRR